MAKLRRITLVDQVVDEIGQLIRDHTSTGTEELPSISELTDRYGVSRVVVREALKSLEAQGMVEVVNGRRARVAFESTRPLVRFFARALDFDPSSKKELTELWRSIEIDAAAMAATNRTATELEEMRRLSHRSSLEVGNRLAFEKLDRELHEMILCATHNRILRDLARSLRDTLSVEVRNGGSESRGIVERLTAHQRSHSRILGAISRRDSEGARRAMELHLQTLRPRTNQTRSIPRPEQAIFMTG